MAIEKRVKRAYKRRAAVNEPVDSMGRRVGKRAAKLHKFKALPPTGAFELTAEERQALRGLVSRVASEALLRL